MKIRNGNSEISSFTEAFLESVARSVNMYSRHGDLVDYYKGRRENRDRLLELYRQILESNPWIKFVYSAGTDGKLLINDYAAPEGYDATARPWYINALKSGPSLSVGLPYREIQTGEWLFSVSKTITDSDSKLLGVLSFDISLEQMNGLLNRTNSFKTQNNYITDGSGIIRVHQNGNYIEESIKELMGDSGYEIPGTSGYAQYTLEDRKRLAYLRKLPVADWVVVSAVDSSEILNPAIRRLILYVLILTFFAVFLGILQSSVLNHKFTAPLARLNRRIKDITEGIEDDSRHGDYGNPEFRQLAGDIEKMTYRTLAMKNEELRLILDTTENGILVVDRGERIIHFNRKFLELWRCDPESEYLSLSDLPMDEMKDSLEEGSRFILENLGNPPENRENRILNIHLKSGSVLEMEYFILGEKDHHRGYFWSFHDVTTKVREQNILREQAATDFLTGLWNRRHFMHRMEYEMEEARLSGQPLALIEMDVDHFKLINDTFGHSTGDDALKFMAASLKSHFRSTDTISRTGGEEFSILLPNADEETADRICEKIRKYFCETAFESQGKNLSFTISQGISFLNDKIENAGEFINRADRALYEAKRRGRNCTVVYGSFPLEG